VLPPVIGLAAGVPPVTVPGMSRLEVLPFSDAYLDAAGALLARRHAVHRRAEPLLAPRYADAGEATREVAELWKAGASGAVARSGGHTVGYLLGLPLAVDRWGPNVWVPPAGHAVDDAETVRDLYAVAAARWVDEGRTAHYAVVPAGAPALVDAWFRLGFGQQQVHGVREPLATPPPVPDGVAVRHGRPADAAALAPLDLVLPQHQAQSPVFSDRPVPTLAEALEDWVETLEDPRYTTFLAELDGAVVGAAVGCPAEESSLHAGPARPDAASYLIFAAVVPEARGHGVGSALGRAVLGWSATAGYRAVVTDWRATNLLSSRTWPKIGFRPAFLRLHRQIGR